MSTPPAVTGIPLSVVARYLDSLLQTAETPDYTGAVNGVQVEHIGPVRRVAVAVDASIATIEGAMATEANLLVVHHGLLWSGTQPLTGRHYQRYRRLFLNDIAVYSSHLPLDRHPDLGNNVLLARALGLNPRGGFSRFQSITVGVYGEVDLPTHGLADRARVVAHAEGGSLIAVGLSPDRRTRRWAVCSGAGASSESLREAVASGIDTLVVGEGPHHTAVEAEELGIAVLYLGHYATETFGVRALGSSLSERFGLPWSFIPAPTGL